MSTSRDPTARLFLALWPPSPIRSALQAWQQQWGWPPGAALVDPQRLHLTLHFLGQVPLARLAEFREALAVPFEPHALALGEGRPHVWPGGIAVLETPAPAALLALHDSLGRALRSLHWTVEARRLRPHVTFARRAQGAQPPPAGPGDLPAWKAEEGYVLVRSVPGRGYEILHAYPCT